MKLPQFDHILWGLGPLTDGSLTITRIEKEYHLQPSTSMGCNMSIFPYSKSGFWIYTSKLPHMCCWICLRLLCTMVNHHFAPPFWESIFWNIFFFSRSILESQLPGVVGRNFFFVLGSSPMGSIEVLIPAAPMGFVDWARSMPSKIQRTAPRSNTKIGGGHEGVDTCLQKVMVN